MFRAPSPQNTPRARSQQGQLVPLAVPVKGMNARDSLAVMGPEYAISLINVQVEAYGLRTRKGYTEWATNLPGATAVPTVMHYYPATATPAAITRIPLLRGVMRKMMVEPRADGAPPVGKLFAATNGQVFDVTAGGFGPWTPQAGVSGLSNYWTWLNFQNLAGSWLLAANDAGGYAAYNGATWVMPVMGSSAGQIANIDPAKFVYVMEWKKRLWFIEKDSTRAWYLPVGQITGAATMFDFGEQFAHGGKLVALANWTVDGGVGVDDYLIAVGAQGDVVIYKGSDPDDVNNFALSGVYYVGPLPVGRRSVLMTGADVNILSQFGVTPVSLLLNSSTQVGQLEQRRASYIIAPLIARLMRDYSTLPGWQVQVIPKEELFLIGVPKDSPLYGGQYFVMKTSTGGWSLAKDVPYDCFCNVDASCFSGTFDGRVVRAYDGPLDNVPIGQQIGNAVQCQVTPAYQPMGAPGTQKMFKLLRPTFITTLQPTLRLQIMTDYGPPKPALAPTLPSLIQSRWDEDYWDEARWSGIQEPIHEWLGVRGVGFVGTVQLDYKCGGDTVLAAIDFWVQEGGVM